MVFKSVLRSKEIKKKVEEYNERYRINHRIRVKKYKKYNKKNKFTPIQINFNDVGTVNWIKIYDGLSVEEYKKLIQNPCQNCGSNYNKHLHHIVPRKLGGSNSAGNRAILCKSCHEKVHGRKFKI
jgi:5-methylcytosine-specific restriction endonuclease McrA